MFYRIIILIVISGFITCKETKNDNPDFAKDIAPIIRKNCSKCHVDGGAGPFNLVNYEEVASKGKLIAYVTENKIMPPWPADP